MYRFRKTMEPIKAEGNRIDSPELFSVDGDDECLKLIEKNLMM